MGGLSDINAALSDKPVQTDGALNKKGYDIRDFSPNPNRAKMKALGLSTMPDDGQDGLDRMYSEYQASKAKAKSKSKGSKASRMYKSDSDIDTGE